MPSRRTLRKAKLTLWLISIGAPVAAFTLWLQYDGGPKAYAIAFLPLAIGLWMTIDLLRMAWTDIAARDLSPRARFELLLVMALVTPIAGSVYWLRRKDEETLELR
jgi:hypothetical protein